MDRQYIFLVKKYYKMTLSGSPSIEGNLILEDGKKVKNACLSFSLSGIYICRSFEDMLHLKDIGYIYYSDMTKVKFSKAEKSIDFYQHQQAVVLRIICSSKFYKSIKSILLHNSYLNSSCFIEE